MTRRFLRAAGLAAALCASLIAAPPAQAQSYPTKPVTMVSPYLPGGGADSIGRLIAEAASRELGQPIVVESKPGAEGAIGSLDVAKSPADGYRILYGGAGSMMMSTAVRKNPSFDPVAAFTPIAATVDFAMFLYVHPSFPANNLKEFLAYVKANPGKVSYAASGGLSLLNMAALESKYGLEMVRIPYKGEPAAATDLVTDVDQRLRARRQAQAAGHHLAQAQRAVPQRADVRRKRPARPGVRRRLDGLLRAGGHTQAHRRPPQSRLHCRHVGPEGPGVDAPQRAGVHAGVA
jgi:tripartite-type tricarboxylate transporter receptor subunit TctC